MPFTFARPIASPTGMPSEANNGNFAWWGNGEPPQYANQKPAPLGTGSKNPIDFWYFVDPWMGEYRSTTGQWPPPDPGSDPTGYSNWVDGVQSWCPYACWPYNSIIGGYNQPQNNRAQWFKPDWTADPNWAAAQNITTLRLDAMVGPHKWITGNPADESEIFHWAYSMGFYENNQDYPAVPSSWQASRYHGSATVTIGPAGGFRRRFRTVSIPVWGGLSKSDIENRVWAVILWRQTSTPRSNVELCKMWAMADATFDAPVPPGTGPAVATLSNVG